MERTETRTLLRLAWPAALTQLAMMMLGVVDTMMASHHSVDTLAAAAIAHQWSTTVLAFGIGAVMGIDPLISQAYGARDEATMSLGVQRGIVLSFVVSVPVLIAHVLTERVLLASGQDPIVARDAHRVVMLQLPSVPFFLLTVALRHYLQARNILRPALLVMIAGNLFNVVGNWALIFGHLGFPEMGLDGAAIATAVTRVLIFVLLALAIVRGKLHVGAWQGWSRTALDPKALAHVLSVGAPIGLQFLLEFGAFTVATFLAGRLGVIALGAHMVVLNLASLTFMVPLGVSIAAATRIGNLVGAGDVVTLRQSMHAAYALGVGAMAAFGVIFVVFDHALPTLYSDNAELISLAAWIMPIAAAFQICDGAQTVSAGVLRGMGRTTAPAVVTVLAHYTVGLPLGYYFAVELGHGLWGLWLGLAIALTLVAIVLATWTVRASTRPIRV